MTPVEVHPFYIYSSIFVLFWALTSLFDNFLITTGLCAGCGLLCEVLRQFLDKRDQEDVSGAGVVPVFEAPTKPLPPEPESDNEAGEEDEFLVVRSLESFQNESNALEEKDNLANLNIAQSQSFVDEDNHYQPVVDDDDLRRGNEVNDKDLCLSANQILNSDPEEGNNPVDSFREPEGRVDEDKDKIEIHEEENDIIHANVSMEQPELVLSSHESYQKEQFALEDHDDDNGLDFKSIGQNQVGLFQDNKVPENLTVNMDEADDEDEDNEVHAKGLGFSPVDLPDSDADEDEEDSDKSIEETQKDIHFQVRHEVDRKEKVEDPKDQDESGVADEVKPRRPSDGDDDSEEEGPDDVEDDEDEDIELVSGNKSVETSSSSSDYEEKDVSHPGGRPDGERPIDHDDQGLNIKKPGSEDIITQNLLDFGVRDETKTAVPALPSGSGFPSHDLLSDFAPEEGHQDSTVSIPADNIKEPQKSPPFTAPVLNFESPKGEEQVDGVDPCQDDKLTFLLQDAQIDDDSNSSSSSSSDGPNFHRRSLVDEGDPWSSNKRDSLGETVSQPDSDELVYDISHRAVFGDDGEADEGELDDDLETDGNNQGPSSPRDGCQPESTSTLSLTKSTKSEDDVNPEEKSKESDSTQPVASPLIPVPIEASGASILTESGTSSSKYNITSEENMFELDGVSNISQTGDLVKPTTLPQPLISTELRFAELQRVSPGAEEEASLIDIE